MLVKNAHMAAVGTVSANDITKESYVVYPTVPVSTGAKAYSPPIIRKGKLVCFQHGLGADWRELAMTIAGTSLKHASGEKLSATLEKKIYGSKKEVQGLVQLDNRFKDVGVVTKRKENTEFTIAHIENLTGDEENHCTHNCIKFIGVPIVEMLRQGGIVCVKTEFSTGQQSIKDQLEQLKELVKKVEAVIASDIKYDVAFVGHSMGGLASINCGMDYAKNNRERKVDIITISTPYYENDWAKFEYDQPEIAEFVLKRKNYGAQTDLAGYSSAMIELQKKWNEHIASEAGKNTSLGAIAIRADLLHNSDYIVPDDAQRGIMPEKIKDEIKKMKVKGFLVVEKEYDQKINKLQQNLDKYCESEKEQQSILNSLKNSPPKNATQILEELELTRVNINSLNRASEKAKKKISQFAEDIENFRNREKNLKIIYDSLLSTPFPHPDDYPYQGRDIAEVFNELEVVQTAINTSEQTQKKARDTSAKNEKELAKFSKQEKELQELYDSSLNTPQYTAAQQSNAFDALETIQGAIIVTKREIEKYEGLKSKLRYYDYVEPYKGVKVLGFVKTKRPLKELWALNNPLTANIFVYKQILKVAALKDDYHHVNTSDLQDVIEIVKENLLSR